MEDELPEWCFVGDGYVPDTGGTREHHIGNFFKKGATRERSNSSPNHIGTSRNRQDRCGANKITYQTY